MKGKQDPICAEQANEAQEELREFLLLYYRQMKPVLIYIERTLQLNAQLSPQPRKR